MLPCQFLFCLLQSSQNTVMSNIFPSKRMDLNYPNYEVERNKDPTHSCSHAAGDVIKAVTPWITHCSFAVSLSQLPTASNRARRFLDATSGHLLLKEARRSIPVPGCYPCSSEPSCLAPKPAAYVPQGCPLPAAVLGEVLKRKKQGAVSSLLDTAVVFSACEEKPEAEGRDVWREGTRGAGDAPQGSHQGW